MDAVNTYLSVGKTIAFFFFFAGGADAGWEAEAEAGGGRGLERGHRCALETRADHSRHSKPGRIIAVTRSHRPTTVGEPTPFPHIRRRSCGASQHSKVLQRSVARRMNIGVLRSPSMRRGGPHVSTPGMRFSAETPSDVADAINTAVPRIIISTRIQSKPAAGVLPKLWSAPDCRIGWRASTRHHSNYEASVDTHRSPVTSSNR